MSHDSVNRDVTTLSPPPVGQFFNVQGRRLFAHRAGSGAVPIVFLPGAGTVGFDYFATFEMASALGTAIIYDRAGTGWSDAVALPRTPDEVTDELREFLHAAGVESPYLLVGHSLGGGYAQHYARRFPAEVCALLLLDPAHEDYPKYEPPQLAAAAAASGDLSDFQLPPEVLEMFRALFADKFAAYRADVRDAVIEYHVQRWRVGLLEASNLAALYAQFASAPPLGDIPTIVLTALSLDPGSRLFMPDELQRLVIEGKVRLNTALAASLPRGEQRMLPEAAHSFMQAERPDAVAQAIRDLLADAPRA